MAKILIADDSNYMRNQLTDILKDNGYNDIIQVENGKAAVERFYSDKPDLLLLDIIMPQMDGISVLKQLVPKGARAVVISAVGQDDIIKQAREAGAKGYIIKPFEEENIIGEVKKALAVEEVEKEA